MHFNAFLWKTSGFTQSTGQISPMGIEFLRSPYKKQCNPPEKLTELVMCLKLTDGAISTGSEDRRQKLQSR